MGKSLCSSRPQFLHLPYLFSGFLAHGVERFGGHGSAQLKEKSDTSGMGREVASGIFIMRIRVFLGSSFLVRKGRIQGQGGVCEKGKERQIEGTRLSSRAKPPHSPAGPQGTQASTERREVEDCLSSSWGLARLGYSSPVSVTCFLDQINRRGFRRTRFLSTRREI